MMFGNYKMYGLLNMKIHVQKALTCQALEIIRKEVLASENFLKSTTTNGQTSKKPISAFYTPHFLEKKVTVE